MSSARAQRRLQRQSTQQSRHGSSAHRRLRDGSGRRRQQQQQQQQQQPAVTSRPSSNEWDEQASLEGDIGEGCRRPLSDSDAEDAEVTVSRWSIMDLG